ncbi:hypothetical protein [Paenibacillus sp. 23TSA30-6]|uniref:hypothetical protein n=1 Tax=Paenibacillus sp. 23TSA30-6 TaxID=2546104 RepID=UPI0017889771|nr:hypothetical protein [Paenibacillus sp. 23TSA30-6]MBE0336037.1 hypothetical protein [Paenibacillus sp. 23TSA30-6]
MSDNMEINEQFVLEEDELVKRIFTCTETSAMVLYLFYEKGQTLDAKTVEDILSSIHNIQQDLETELLHLRIEKTIVATRNKKEFKSKKKD